MLIIRFKAATIITWNIEQQAMEQSMRKFSILSGTHKNKKIEVIKYKILPAGVEIEIKHNVPAVVGKTFRWVQTLSSNDLDIRKCKLPYIVDPFGDWDPSIHRRSLPGLVNICKADDLKPFYWIDAQVITHGPNLTDGPQTPDRPPSGRYWWKFVTALVEVTGTNVHHLVAITWGYDIMHDGKIKRGIIQRATTTQMKNHGQALKKMYSSYTFN